ncbi:uncharacterized protein LOC110849786 [Folsomia candida]|uniref:Putative kinetochore protein NDC80 n=1 Tax=Folsomia candida TaxID=158441 RepID=A0A226EC07_FOLCA|nr:uncharacterized protein LOC110849786 [Folsomia candida]OXA55105.1 putative kinetochore protein NDC80 [Folsomia candida]
MKLFVLLISFALTLGQDTEFQSLGDSMRNIIAKYGEKETLRVFQEGRIEARISSYIDELFYRNRTEGEETKRIYAELQDALSDNREANEAWDIVARGKGENLEVVIGAAYRLDAILGEEVSGSRRGFWDWVKKNWKTIVQVTVAVVELLVA